MHEIIACSATTLFQIVYNNHSIKMAFITLFMYAAIIKYARKMELSKRINIEGFLAYCSLMDERYFV